MFVAHTERHTSTSKENLSPAPDALYHPFTTVDGVLLLSYSRLVLFDPPVENQEARSREVPLNSIFFPYRLYNTCSREFTSQNLFPEVRKEMEADATS